MMILKNTIYYYCHFIKRRTFEHTHPLRQERLAEGKEKGSKLKKLDLRTKVSISLALLFVVSRDSPDGRARGATLGKAMLWKGLGWCWVRSGLVEIGEKGPDRSSRGR